MSTRHLLLRLMREFVAEPILVLGAITSLVGLAGSQLCLPWLIQNWIEGPMMGEGDIGAFITLASALVVAIAVFLLASRALLARINHGVLERLRYQTVNHLLEVEPATLAKQSTGDLLSRVLQDAQQLSGFAETVLKRLLGDGAVALGALIMMFVLHPLLAAVACTLAPVMALLLVGLGRIIRRLGGAAQDRMGDLSSTLQEQLQGFSTIKGYRGETVELDRFQAANAAYRKKAVSSLVWAAVLVALVFLLAAAGFVAAVAFGSRQVAAGTLTPGGLLAFCLYAGQTIEPVRRLAEMQGILQRSLAAAERLFAISQLPVPERQEPKQPDSQSRPAASSLQLEGVHFRYPGGPAVLLDIDLTVEPREQLAVVAASGGGKSTLAGLLIRFLEPEQGRIIIDGIDLGQLPRQVLRQRVRVVEQDPFLFSGSVADNVRYGSWSASPNAVTDALGRAGLGPWLEDDPRGLHAPLGEGGRELSGGQRQRVSLARAVLSDPSLLVLDEATSAIDSESEAEIFQLLTPWLEQRTVIVLAHRLATVRRMRRVIVLDGGRVVADGPPAELEAKDSTFRALFSEQMTPSEQS